MKKIKAFFLTIIIVLSMCVGCAEPILQVPTDPFLVEDDVFDNTNEIIIDYYEYVNAVNEERRENISKPLTLLDEEVEDLTVQHAGDLRLLTSEETKMLLNNNLRSSVTRELAYEDIKLLFRLFFSSYGPYEYFGSENFDNAEKEIILEIDNIFETSNQINSDVFEQIIKDHLEFIVDDHMRIGKESSVDFNEKRMIAYYDNSHVFREDELGYYTKIYDKKWYLKEINGKEPENFLQITIDDSGELVYVIVDIINEATVEKRIDDNYVLMRGDVSVNCNIIWTRFKTTYEGIFASKTSQIDILGENREKEPLAGLKIQDGVPILSVRKMDNDESDVYEKQLEAFMKSGSELKNQDLFIVDARSNGGGYSQYPATWYVNYTEINREPYPKIHSFLNTFAIENELPVEVGDSMNNVTGATLVENDNNIIFLTDKSAASCGEYIVQYFRVIDNVLFLGTNTAGCVLSSGGGSYRLPNSGINFDLGILFNLCYNDVDHEGSGYMPDVFVNSNEADTLALKMIEFYGIEKSENTDELTLFGWEK